MRVVPFDGLWKMQIDIPYSLLVGDNESAWTCGQLAMDGEAWVLAAGDVERQSEIVADYLAEILRRAEVQAHDVRRLVQYYVPSDGTPADAPFLRVFGEDVLIDRVPVPAFYYDGVLLEVDAFCGPPTRPLERVRTGEGEIRLLAGERESWMSLSTTVDGLAATVRAADDLLPHHGVVLSEHWLAPRPVLGAAAAALAESGRDVDSGAIVDVGPRDEPVRARWRVVAGDDDDSLMEDVAGARVLARRVGRDLWIQARSLDPTLDLVPQTAVAVDAISTVLGEWGVGFQDVAKQTAHYVGGTAAELHDNMEVRNRRYSKPGPASTGIPVHGFAAPGCRNVVDVTVRRGWRL